MHLRMDGGSRVARRSGLSVDGTRLLVLLTILVATGLGPHEAQAQATFYDRSEVPGHYSLGLYADAQGTKRQLTLEADENAFEAHLGITGDSTQVFSGVVFGLEVPDGVELEGAIRWKAIPGLTQWGSPFEEGVRVEFNEECQPQTGPQPVMVGRLRFKVDDNFQSGEIVVREHRRWGVSVELCDPARDWPKPYAEPVNLSVERKRSFWSKLQDMFR